MKCFGEGVGLPVLDARTALGREAEAVEDVVRVRLRRGFGCDLLGRRENAPEEAAGSGVGVGIIGDVGSCGCDGAAGRLVVGEDIGT